MTASTAPQRGGSGMCDKRILWALPACVALAGCVASERVPLAEAVAEAGAYSEYIGMPPAVLFADLTERDSDEVVFVTVNNGTVTLARADGVEGVLAGASPVTRTFEIRIADPRIRGVFIRVGHSGRLRRVFGD